MKKLMALTLVVVVLGVMVPTGAVPTVPPIPPIPTQPPTESPQPTPGPKQPPESQQKFEVISSEPTMEGYVGTLVEFKLKVIQQGYPELEVHLTADVPDKWTASFSKNDFDLASGESVELILSVSPPESTIEKQEIKVHAVGKAKEGSTQAKDSVVLTVMTYLVDIGVVNLQIQPPQQQIKAGEQVTISATAVNFTQRNITNVAVELLVNNKVTSRQAIDLPAGVSLPVTFGWTAAAGTYSLAIRSQAQGDSNKKNDAVSLQIVVGGGVDMVDALYQQALAFYMQGNYSAAMNLFASAAAQYAAAGEAGKSVEATQYQDICNSYMQAQAKMDQGELAFSEENYQQAAQYFQEARDTYSRLGDTEKQTFAQERLNEALEAQKSAINPLYIGISAVAIIGIALAAMLLSRRGRGPVRSEPSSRFRLEEPVSYAEPPPVGSQIGLQREAPVPVRASAPTELVQFHQKTEDALSKFTKGYIRDNLQQAMRVYLTLEGERKQLPRGKDLELERIISANLKELEHRIFGTF